MFLVMYFVDLAFYFESYVLKMDVAPFKTMCLLKPNVYFALLFVFVFRGCLVFRLEVV